MCRVCVSVCERVRANASVFLPSTDTRVIEFGRVSIKESVELVEAQAEGVKGEPGKPANPVAGKSNQLRFIRFVMTATTIGAVVVVTKRYIREAACFGGWVGGSCLRGRQVNRFRQNRLRLRRPVRLLIIAANAFDKRLFSQSYRHRTPWKSFTPNPSTSRSFPHRGTCPVKPLTSIPVAFDLNSPVPFKRPPPPPPCPSHCETGQNPEHVPSDGGHFSAPELTPFSFSCRRRR